MYHGNNSKTEFLVPLRITIVNTLLLTGTMGDISEFIRVLIQSNANWKTCFNTEKCVLNKFYSRHLSLLLLLQ